MKPSTTFTAIDIGTSKIACVVSVLDNFGQLNMLGLGEIPWDGVRKGGVTNVNKTAEIIRKAVGLAKQMAGVEVQEVWVNISGEQIRSFMSTGMVVVKHTGREITELDKLHVIEAAKAVQLPEGSKILHAFAQEFILDGQQGIEQPVGLNGVRLESRVLICTGTETSVQSIEKSVKKAGLAVAGIVLDPLASGYAVLSTSEKKLGVVLVDIGGHATNIAVYLEDTVRYVGVVGLGSNDITRDIAHALQVPVKTAEEVKKQSGSSGASLSLRGMVDGHASLKGAKEISKKDLAAIIDPRAKEILLKVKDELKKSGYIDALPSGIVLTGGGVLLKDICKIAERIFKVQVRVGLPTGFGGLTEIVKSPTCATGVGLCMYAAKRARENKNQDAPGFIIESIYTIVNKIKRFF